MAKIKADRQGDVVLIHSLRSIDSLLSKAKIKPEKRDSRGRLVLAEGEVTGHAHVIDAPKGAFLYRERGKNQFGATEELLLVVQETQVQRGQLIEGQVIQTMPAGSIRFRQSDGTVLRFKPSDITIREGVGVVVNRAYTPVKHDEHDAIPLSKGVYNVRQQETMVSPTRRMRVAD